MFCLDILLSLDSVQLSDQVWTPPWDTALGHRLGMHPLKVARQSNRSPPKLQSPNDRGMDYPIEGAIVWIATRLILFEWRTLG